MMIIVKTPSVNTLLNQINRFLGHGWLANPND
jgi:hypothetical protein